MTRCEPDTHFYRQLRSGLFGDFFGSGLLPAGRSSSPALNLWEDETNVYAECEIPGVRPEDLELSLTGRELRLRGSWKQTTPENATVHRSERVEGSFERLVRLGIDVDAEQITARLVDGVLSITLPRSAKALPRKVEIKAHAG